MNRLPSSKQEQVIHTLLEGCSLRSTERLTGVHRDTIMRLMVRVGKHCENLMERHIQNVQTNLIACDEAWTYVGKKDKRLSPLEQSNPEIGSQFVFIAMDTETKLIPAFSVGKRTLGVALNLMGQLRQRVRGRAEIVTDGLDAYIDAVEQAFGSNVDFAQLVKTFQNGNTPIRETYAPAHRIVRCHPVQVQGHIDEWRVSTSLIERQNATLRTFVKRLHRMTLCFSKKLENLKAALSMHFCWYNFGRVHGSLRCTPAMEAGMAGEVWEVGRLLPT